MPTILTAADYPTIRNIMGVTITQVPDATLADFAHEPLADVWAQNLVPTFATLTGNDLINLKAATAYYTAYLTSSALALIIFDKLKLGDAEYQRNRQLDWQARGEEWLQQAWLYMASVSTRKALDTEPPKPSLTGPTRSGVSV